MILVLSLLWIGNYIDTVRDIHRQNDIGPVIVVDR